MIGAHLLVVVRLPCFRVGGVTTPRKLYLKIGKIVTYFVLKSVIKSVFNLLLTSLIYLSVNITGRASPAQSWDDDWGTPVVPNKGVIPNKGVVPKTRPKLNKQAVRLPKIETFF